MIFLIKKWKMPFDSQASKNHAFAFKNESINVSESFVLLSKDKYSIENCLK